MLVLREAKVYLIGWAMFFIAGLAVVLNEGRETLHLKMNELHSPFADMFFKWVTFIGDGLFAAALALALLFIKLRYGLMMLTAWLLSGLTTQLLKRTVFSDVKRPGHVFEGTDLLHIPEGVELNMANSFPSGHSTTIFAVCCALAFIGRSRKVEVFLIILAILVAYSRVHISQHFAQDIVAGSFIGVVGACIAYAIWRNVNKKWIDKGLVDLVSK